MISLKLKSGKILELTPKSEDGSNFLLIDKDGNTQFKLIKSDNRLLLEDYENIDESEDELRQKLNSLYIQIENENTFGIEDDNDSSFVDPFDPEEISINTKPFTMDSCLRRLIQNTIILNPDFQRKEVWTKDKKSRLIESLMLRIPIPMFYVSADEKANFTMVDGLQRFSTIRDFVLGKEYLETKDERFRGEGFKLQDLEFWKEYEGKNFNELPTNITNRILETEFTFTIINPGTPEEVKRNIFKRINTGGLPLSSQEIRNALYIGRSTLLLNNLASLGVFSKATDYSIKDSRMEDKELILRFISFLVRSYKSFTKAVSVDTWLSDTMIIVNSLPELNTRELDKQVKKDNATIEFNSILHLNVSDIEERFKKAMDRSFKLFDKHTFRKSYPGNRRTPINKSLFETWGILLSELSESKYNLLFKNRSELMKDYKKLIDDYEFGVLISRDSMKPNSVKKRFETISELIDKYSV